MEEDYNWVLILWASAPIAVIEAYLFFINIKDGMKWFSLVLGVIITGGIVYFKDKRKNNIFTAVGVVFLITLLARFLKNSGIL